MRRSALGFAFVALTVAAGPATSHATADDVPPPPAPAVPATPPAPPAPAPAAPPAPTPAPAPAAPASNAAPKLVLDRTLHDFGPCKQNDRVKADFTVTNAGSATLHVASVRGDCGCANATISRKEIEAGGTATVSVTFETNRFVGPMTKALRIMSDDPEHPETVVTLKVDVSAGIVLGPPNFFFNMALVGAKPTATVDAKWKEGVGKPFKITSVESANLVPAGVKVEFATEAFDAPPWHGWKITMTFPEPPPVGAVSGHALIRTDDPDNPKVQTLIGGAISGRVVVSLLKPSFGIVPKGKGGKLFVRLRPFDSTIDLGTVAAKARKGTVLARAVADEHMKGEWVVELELPKDAAPGPIDDVVDLTTAVKGEESIALEVSGTVMP